MRKGATNFSELGGGDVYKIDEKIMQEKKNSQMHGPQNNSFRFIF